MPTKAGKSAGKAVRLFIGTRKGAFVLESDKERRQWKVSEPLYLGHIVHHWLADPRDPNVVLMAAKTGHLGPTLFRSLDGGQTWQETKVPPAFPKSDEGDKGRSVESVFWLTPGLPEQKNVWWAGTAPAGLFKSEDNGLTWQPVAGFNDNPMYKEWAAFGPTPGGQLVHSILVDPRNNGFMYLSISPGGTFESTDGGQSWAPMNNGCAADFMPDPNVDFGHDPHCVAIHPLAPDRLYQQNHCGIYRIDRPGRKWMRIGKNMPAEVGDIGFPIVLHPRNPDCAWVFPMDGSTVWPRTSPGGKPSTYVTKDAGASWSRQDKGLPAANAYFTVKRQAMTCDWHDPLGLYFGTSQGEIWGSADEGESWSCLVQYLPEVYSLTVAEAPA
jgi:photosystem II stability/assembly factor-like uncharacterized protein